MAELSVPPLLIAQVTFPSVTVPPAVVGQVGADEPEMPAVVAVSVFPLLSEILPLVAYEALARH